MWALTPPGYLKDWHVGVRNTKTGKLMGFITGVPAEISVNRTVIQTAEINFLCVHKSLRSKRLAPVLIKEITRRVNLTDRCVFTKPSLRQPGNLRMLFVDRWQAVYTAGVVLPRPVARGRYWHRSLNPKKLIEVRELRRLRCISLTAYADSLICIVDQVLPSAAPHDNVHDDKAIQAGRPPHSSPTTHDGGGRPCRTQIDAGIFAEVRVYSYTDFVCFVVLLYFLVSVFADRTTSILHSTALEATLWHISIFHCLIVVDLSYDENINFVFCRRWV